MKLHSFCLFSFCMCITAAHAQQRQLVIPISVSDCNVCCEQLPALFENEPDIEDAMIAHCKAEGCLLENFYPMIGNCYDDPPSEYETPAPTTSPSQRPSAAQTVRPTTSPSQSPSATPTATPTDLFGNPPTSSLSSRMLNNKRRGLHGVEVYIGCEVGREFLLGGGRFEDTLEGFRCMPNAAGLKLVTSEENLNLIPSPGTPASDLAVSVEDCIDCCYNLKDNFDSDPEHERFNPFACQAGCESLLTCFGEVAHIELGCALGVDIIARGVAHLGANRFFCNNGNIIQGQPTPFPVPEPTPTVTTKQNKREILSDADPVVIIVVCLALIVVGLITSFIFLSRKKRKDYLTGEPVSTLTGSYATSPYGHMEYSQRESTASRAGQFPPSVVSNSHPKSVISGSASQSVRSAAAPSSSLQAGGMNIYAESFDGLGTGGEEARTIEPMQPSNYQQPIDLINSETIIPEYISDDNKGVDTDA